MFSLLYDLGLFLLGIIALPMVLWQMICKGKYRKNFKARLGLELPHFIKKKQVIWIHATSMGETRAAAALYNSLKQAYPAAAILVSTTTETGHAEALRSMPTADAHFVLPLDFSCIMRRLVKKIQPSLLILVESDFWYHLLKYSKEQGATVVLVNGKMSERSFKRFAFFRGFSRKLFSLFDDFCLQSQRFYDRFSALGIPREKLHVTGNLKFDAPLPKLAPGEVASWKEKFGISSQNQVLTIGSTHHPEEEWLLSALEPVWKTRPSLKVFLVPRHPERFETVATLLKSRAIPFIRYSQLALKTGQEKVILIDAMGFLRPCYQLSDIALVAGSYSAEVGGHNIMEPVQLGIPVLFGPHMHAQLDMVEEVLLAKAGLRVPLDDLPRTLLHLLQTPSDLNNFRHACINLSTQIQGATLRTFLVFSKNKI